MQSNRTRLYWFLSGITLLLFTAGCFQPAGGGLEATSVGQSAPTFTAIPSATPFPTETPVPTQQPTLEPTLEPTDIVLIAASNTPDPLALLQGTPIAMLPQAQGDDPLVQTATALALIQAGQSPQQVQPTQQPTQPVIDPLALTATHIVNQATQAAAIPLTQTAQAALGATSTFTPSPTVFGATPGTPVPTGSCVHTVVAGQNLFRISLQYNTTVDALAAANNIVNPALIFVDQQIVIPGCGTDASAQTVGTPSANSGAVHIVQQGETLFQISLQYGVTVNDLAARNSITNINLILIGQEIVIP
jgi:LysM repeat protein